MRAAARWAGSRRPGTHSPLTRSTPGRSPAWGTSGRWLRWRTAPRELQTQGRQWGAYRPSWGKGKHDQAAVPASRQGTAQSCRQRPDGTLSSPEPPGGARQRSVPLIPAMFPAGRVAAAPFLGAPNDSWGSGARLPALSPTRCRSTWSGALKGPHRHGGDSPTPSPSLREGAVRPLRRRRETADSRAPVAVVTGRCELLPLGGSVKPSAVCVSKTYGSMQLQSVATTLEAAPEKPFLTPQNRPGRLISPSFLLGRDTVHTPSGFWGSATRRQSFGPRATALQSLWDPHPRRVFLRAAPASATAPFTARPVWKKKSLQNVSTNLIYCQQMPRLGLQ